MSNGPEQENAVMLEDRERTVLHRARRATEARPCEPPLPPSELRLRVAGTNDADWFLDSGRMTLVEFAEAIALLDRRLDDFKHIYDFGCGCGRVLRWLPQFAPNAKLYGSDIDAPAVAWCREHLPGVEARVNQGLPPLPFETAAFDLVLGFSVLTHLDENYQDAWLAELQRVTKPGAVLLLTVHGGCHWGWMLAKNAKLEKLQDELAQRGFLYNEADDWGNHFPDFYHTSWHLPWYIRTHWSAWFTVLDVLEMRGLRKQDMVILWRGSLQEAPIAKLQASLSARTAATRPSILEPKEKFVAYGQMVKRIRDAVEDVIPRGATVAVVGKGDNDLLELGGRKAWHFPQNEQGGYAGYHPADSKQAIMHLADLLEKGAEYLVFPHTAEWWLVYYPEFFQHLETNHRLLLWRPETCVIFALGRCSD
jgi:SAM-dependent methyltransferase